MRLRVAAIVLPLALGLLLAPLAAAAQPLPKVARIGLLLPGTAPDPGVEAFRQGLRDLGWVEGQNIAIEYRWAEGKFERLPGLAAALIRLKVDVIVANATPATSAAKNATGTIPVVFAFVADPVASGFVASLARPGGNITGLASIATEVIGKQLELLKEALPKVSRVAVLRNPDNQSHPLMLRQAESAARVLRVQLQILEARSPDEFDTAFAAMTRQRAGGLLVLADSGMFFVQRTRIADLAAKNRLPAVYGHLEHAEAGGLMAYGTNRADLFRRAAYFVDKILKGAKPDDLPVEQPTKFELVINLKTAKALGLTIPKSVLVRADKLIE